MVTDTERCEVARRLREFSKDRWPLTVGGNSAMIRYAISDTVFGDKKYHSGVDLLDRLADLIDPGCDRDALLEQAKELEKCAWYFGLDFDADEPLRDRLKEASEDFAECARRIREACGERAS